MADQRSILIGLTLTLCAAQPLGADDGSRPGFGRIDPGEHPIDVTESDTMSDWFTPDGEPLDVERDSVLDEAQGDTAPGSGDAEAPENARSEVGEPSTPTPAFVGPIWDPSQVVEQVEPQRPRSVLDGLQPGRPLDEARSDAVERRRDAADGKPTDASLMVSESALPALTEVPPRLARPLGAASSLPLGPQGAEADAASASVFSLDQPESYIRTGAALAVVLGCVLLLGWLVKRVAASRPGLAAAMGAGGPSPAGLLEVLGRYPIGPKQSLVLLKFDRRILLLSQTSSRAGGTRMETVCELSEPEDVASVLVKAREHSGKSPAGLFRSAMRNADAQATAALSAAQPAQGNAKQPKFTRPDQRAAQRPVEVAPRSLYEDEQDREALWAAPASRPEPEPGEDPVGLLRRRLEAMRQSERVR